MTVFTWLTPMSFYHVISWLNICFKAQFHRCNYWSMQWVCSDLYGILFDTRSKKYIWFKSYVFLHLLITYWRVSVSFCASWNKKEEKSVLPCFDNGVYPLGTLLFSITFKHIFPLCFIQKCYSKQRALEIRNTWRKQAETAEHQWEREIYS